jgi:hypothetical protein
MDDQPKPPAKKRTAKPRTPKSKPIAQSPDPFVPNEFGVIEPQCCTKADASCQTSSDTSIAPIVTDTRIPESINPWDTTVNPREYVDALGEAASTTPVEPADGGKISGNVRKPVGSSGGLPSGQLLESIPRARLNGEKRHAYWERMRKAARLAGLPRGQGPESAYVWATQQAELEFPCVSPVIPAELPETESTIVDKTDQPAVATESTIVDKTESADLGVAGLGDIPDHWPALPANAQLQVEIAWVSANRLKVRSGRGVDLARALSPAPSYSALSWLETSILFPSKFADISVKATADQDDEKEHIKREKFAIEEIRGILKEMLDAKN